jgi:protein-disulfide isomerase
MMLRSVVGTLITATLLACAKTAESATPDNTPTYGPDAVPVVTDTALLRKADLGRIVGDTAAKTMILEISDFQCPYCKQFHDSTYGTIRREYVDKGTARMAYINLPLRSHQNAWPAAEAAMCASAQGQFWAMHDSVFNSQPRWANMPKPDTMFARIARTLRIDGSAFDKCMSSHATRPLIASDAERASSAGITSTPSFIIGDSLLGGAYPFPAFKRLIDAHIASTQAR